MTTLYKPVLISSAEQAEALPPSTPVIIGPFVAMRPFAADAWGMAYTDGEYSSAELVSSFPDYDLTALVPTEAEEEWTVGHKGPAWAPGTEEWAREFQSHVPGRRLFHRSTTRWEEA